MFLPMKLTRISLINFRCFERLDLEFQDRRNFIIGPNAVGKTSILEAICVLLRLQSPRVSALGRIIRHGAAGFSVQGDCEERLLQFYFGSRRKKLALDRIEQAEGSEYLQIGKVVYFGNADMEIASGSGEARRRFLDFAGMQQSPRYREVARRFQHALRSRNALLKANSPRRTEVEAFNGPLAQAGEELFVLRAALVQQLSNYAPAATTAISSAEETFEVKYQSGATPGNYAEELSRGYSEDVRLRGTQFGPHRDDLEFIVNQTSARHFASEGQQRTLVLALKLAHCRLIMETSGVTPILLFDDIFGELDADRRNGLFNAVPEEAQCFITTTSLAWRKSPEGTIIELGNASAADNG